MKTTEDVRSEHVIFTLENLLGFGTRATIATWSAAVNFAMIFPEGARDPLAQPPKPFVPTSPLRHSIQRKYE